MKFVEGFNPPTMSPEEEFPTFKYNYARKFETLICRLLTQKILPSILWEIEATLLTHNLLSDKYIEAFLNI